MEIIIGLAVVSALGYFFVPGAKEFFAGLKDGKGTIVKDAREVTNATNEAIKNAEAQALKLKCELKDSAQCSP